MRVRATKLIPLDRRTQLPEPELELLTSVPLFRRLPIRVVEQLARSAVAVDVEPGVAVVVQGEFGEAFYVIRSGEVDVEVSGRLVRTLGPGDWFGELALLRNSARSATVTARSALSLLEIDRVPFLMAVTGSPPVREALAEHGDSYH